MKNALCISHVSVMFPSGLKLLVRSWNYKPALIITETKLMQMRIFRMRSFKVVLNLAHFLQYFLLHRDAGLSKLLLSYP